MTAGGALRDGRHSQGKLVSKSPHFVGGQPLALTSFAVELIVVHQTQEDHVVEGWVGCVSVEMSDLTTLDAL